MMPHTASLRLIARTMVRNLAMHPDLQIAVVIENSTQVSQYQTILSIDWCLAKLQLDLTGYGTNNDGCDGRFSFRMKVAAAELRMLAEEYDEGRVPSSKLALALLELAAWIEDAFGGESNQRGKSC